MGSLSDFQVVKVVGAGSFGRAVLVKDKSGKEFIIKVVATGKMRSMELEFVEREIKVLSKLNGTPFIVNYIDAFSDRFIGEKCLCIQMDYCPGGDMHSLIRQRKKERRPFSEKTLKIWLLQLSIALDFMHSHKILHRDLKPANIFLDKRTCLKVGDFGLSKILDHTLQQAHTYCGTPQYMAPELCKDYPYQKAADIWSIGCVMYECATFQPPFQGESITEICKNIVKAKIPAFPTTYSLEFRIICESMLIRNPAQRPTTKDVISSPYLKEELDRIREEQKILGIPI